LGDAIASVNVAPIIYFFNRNQMPGHIHTVDDPDVIQLITQEAVQLAAKSSDTTGGRVVKRGMADGIKGFEYRRLGLAIS
jgi:hypothetical protein